MESIAPTALLLLMLARCGNLPHTAPSSPTPIRETPPKESAAIPEPSNMAGVLLAGTTLLAFKLKRR